MRSRQSAGMLDQQVDEAILEAIATLIVVLDHEGRIVRFNPACERLTGYSQAEVLDRCVWDLFLTEDQRQWAARAFNKVLDGTSAGQCDCDWITRKGPRRIRWTNSVLNGADGKVSLVVGAGTDISDRFRADEALRASEERFRATFEDAAVGMAISDLQGRFQRVNRAYARLTGYSETELQGMTFADITHPDDRESCLSVARRMLESAVQSETFEKRYVTRDGRTVWGHASVSVVHDRAGSPAGWIALVEDFSERKQVQEALRESEERFRQLAGSIDGVFWMVDTARNQCLYVSPWYERIWGRSLESLYRNPKSFLQAIHPDDQPMVMRMLLRNDAHEVEYRIVQPGGAVVWIRDRVFPVKDESGNVYRVCGIAEDITERKRTEQAIRAMNEHLEQLVLQRTEAARESERHYREVAEHNRLLVQEVEHRVRNNLAGLLGLVSVMQARVKDVKTFAAAIESRLRAMTHVHQLLARADWRSLELRFLIESAIASMNSMSAFPAAVELEGPRVLVPPRRVLPLTLILLEWLTNSCKYGAHSVSGGRLRLCWQVCSSPRGPRVGLDWQERGGPPIAGSVTPSLGTELVHAFASRELGGRCEMRFPPEGAEHHLEFLVGTRADAGDAT